MADWGNKGSYRDLSNLLPGDPISALAPTSQEGGNQQSSNELAMTAPGSQPVDILKDRAVQVDPTIEASNKEVIEPSDDGKPQTTEMIGYSPRSPSWQPPTPPNVNRKA
jgi:hypothetical protein